MGSAHNINEIRIKERQGVEIIFISPIFNTKKNKKQLGIVKFKLLSKETKKKVAALGGINKKNVSLLKMANINAISGIRFIEELSNEK